MMSDVSPVWHSPSQVSSRVDRGVAAVLLVVLSPILMIATVAVLLSGPGAVLVRVPVIRSDDALAYRLAFRVSPRMDPERYDAAMRRGRSWITPVGRVLDIVGISRLPVLIDVWAGRVRLSDAFTG